MDSVPSITETCLQAPRGFAGEFWFSYAPFGTAWYRKVEGQGLWRATG
jgi:hypothetical protein